MPQQLVPPSGLRSRRRPDAPGRRGAGIGRLLMAGALAVAAVGLSGCSSNGDADAVADDPTLSDEGMPLGVLMPGEDEEAFEVDPPEPEPTVLSPDELAAFEMPPVPGPDELSSVADDDRAQSIAAAAASPDLDILAVAAIDQNPTASEIAAYGDGLPRNASGRLLALDGPASVACAKVEMAVWALDEGDEAGATEFLVAAVALIDGSDSDGMEAWSSVLDVQASGHQAIDPVTLVDFLEACVAGGHEL